jgi:hypothetical protein
VNFQTLAKALLYRAGFSIKKLRRRRDIRAVTPGQSAHSPRALLHPIDPYAGFDVSAFPLDLQGWGSESAAFQTLLEEVRPELIIEVGTWKGASAIQMARTARQMGLSSEVLCIDTWLGALEFWESETDPARYQSLQLKNGYPSVYYQFLANVIRCDLAAAITPFPQTSSIAAIWLRLHGVSSRLIYIDASHEEEDVYEDLISYWDLVAADGILFGDDYSWDGVKMAVDRFCQEHGVPFAFLHDKWVLRKRPADS